jgi:hypothetical protein
MGNRVSMNVGCCRRGHLFKLKIDTSEEMEESDLRVLSPPQVLGNTARQGKKDGKKRIGEGQVLSSAGTGNSGNKKSSQVKARKKAKRDLGG